MKRILSLALALVTAGLLPAVAPSASAGYGSSGRFLVPVAGSPPGASIAISNVLGLVQIGRDVGYPLNGTYHLTDDIDLSAIDDWTPIGNGDPNGFTGVFDGQGHVIKGLRINGEYTYTGLFSQISGAAAEVKNVGLESATIRIAPLISSVVVAGGICGRNNGTIRNCYNAGDTMPSVQFQSSGSVTVGGICGINERTITDCFSRASVVATSTTEAIAGGICGSSSGTITRCSNSGFADAMSYYDIANPASVPNTLIAGGICGEMTVGQIINCANTGEAFIVSAPDTLTNTYAGGGGICGRNGGSVSDCFSSGMVDNWVVHSSLPPVISADLGGICGTNTGTVKNCYSTSEIWASDGDAHGAICGRNNGTIMATYWDETCRQYIDTIEVLAANKKGIGSGTSGPGVEKMLTILERTDQTSFPEFDFTATWRMRPPSPSGPVLLAFHPETIYRVYVSGGVLPTISSTASVGYFAPGHTVIVVAQPPQYGTFIEWEFSATSTPVTFTDGTSETDATVKFVMPEQDIEVIAVYEFDYPPDPPKPDPFIILSTTDDDCTIDLIAETVNVPAGYDVRGYSVNGGKSWKKGALPTDRAKLSKLFDKEMTLWLTDRTDGRGKPIVHDPVKFPRIQARPKANPEKLKAWYGGDTWSPKGVNGAAPMYTYEYAETTDKKNPTTAWQPIPDGGFPVLSGATKKTYLFRAPATAYDGRYVPASKIFKITPANFGKAPNYAVKTDRKTGRKTVKLKANDWYELSGEAPVKAAAATTLDVTEKTGTLTVWKAETGKKPRTEKKVITL